MTTKQEMIERICAHDPCHGREHVEAWFEPAPPEVSVADALEGAAAVVPISDVWWLAVHLLPLSVRETPLRAAVLRAVRVYTADALERAGLADAAQSLRAVRDDASYEEIRVAAADAARAAASDAECSQQAAELVAAARAAGL